MAITKTETFATAEDGAILTWDVYMPTGAGPFPVLVTIHGGGFKATENSQEQISCNNDAQMRGIIAVAITYRLAPPGTGKPVGQTSQGYYPDCYNDVKRAVLAAKTPPGGSILVGKVNGQVICIGGSAGASLSAVLACDTTTQTVPVAWDTTKRPIACVSLSGALAFDDTMSDPNLAYFQSIVHNFCNTTNLTTLHNDSPYNLVTSAAKPLWMRNGTNENMPQNQLALMTAALTTAGVTNFTSILDNTVVPTKHAWAAYPMFAAQINPWIDAQFAGIPPPPPPVGGTPTGCGSRYALNQNLDSSVLANPDVDLVSLTVAWSDLELTAGVYTFTGYLTASIKAIAAAGKRSLIRVLTSGGSKTFGGNTPDHVFDAIGTALGGPSHVFNDGVSNSTPLIVSATQARFNSADLFQPITGTDIPANSYIGQVVGHTSINLSSSNTVYTPVNATGSHTGNTITLSARPTVAHDQQSAVFGSTYSFDSTNSKNQTTTYCIPVFWEPTYNLKKTNMLSALGQYVNSTAFSAAEQASVSVLAVGVANSISEDWNVPVSQNIQPGYNISQLDAWLNPTNNLTAWPGAGYDPLLVIQAAVNQLLAQRFTDGVANGTNTFTSATAVFRQADVGKQITATQIPAGTTIQKWVNSTTIKLTAGATAGSGITFSIKQRDVGLIDIVMADWPAQQVTIAIANDGPLLDVAGASRDGDTDVVNYLARQVCLQAATKYPGRFIAQVNSVSNKMPTSDNPGDNQFSLLFEIFNSGRPVAGQNLSVVFGDTNYRMNGGIAGDATTILEGAASKGFTYGMSYLEVYSVDCVNLTDAIHFIHDLYTSGGGILPPPPLPGIVPPPVLSITAGNFTDDGINRVSYLLNVDTTTTLSPARAKRWTSGISAAIRYAWRLYAWPQLILIEERAFGNTHIWNATGQFNAGDMIYWIGMTNSDGTITGTGYYQLIGSPTPGTLPTDTSNFTPYTLVASDFFIPELQPCRRRIGDMLQIYGTNPAQGPLDYGYSLQWRRSSRGFEVLASVASNTVFVAYLVVPYNYVSDLWDSTVTYKAGSLVRFTDGQVYRAIVGITAGVDPTDATRWAPVPFPIYFAQYAAYMTASDDADDAASSQRLQSQAMEFLGREVDRQFSQNDTPTYSFGRQSRRLALPLGTSGFLWSIAPPFGVPGTIAQVNTISDICLDEFGSILPTS